MRWAFFSSTFPKVKTMATAPKKQPAASKNSAPTGLPAAIKLKSFYSFYDDDNNHRQWAPDVVISDPEDVALLVERQVEFEAVEQ